MRDRILVISNNVLSNTKNNGKTIYSFFDTLPKDCINQIYFSNEFPEIEGYNYFRISDKDIIKGIFNHHRGNKVLAEIKRPNEIKNVLGKKIPRNVLTCYCRDLIWYKKWYSIELNDWLNSISPTIVFFVAGDTFFSYEICNFVINKFNCRLYTYVTDDYVLPQKKNSLLCNLRRKSNFRLLDNCIKKSEYLYVVSPLMKQYYDKLFNVDSHIIVNMADSHILENTIKKQTTNIEFVYAGSLYYGRIEVLIKLINVLKEYNNTHVNKGVLKIFSSTVLTKKQLDILNCINVSEYMGAVNSTELCKVLNNADVLVFVESFDEKYIEKTKLSLSTKLPEYMSLKKPILAIGPETIGSIDYIKNETFCVTDLKKISEVIQTIFNSDEERVIKAKKAYDKYLRNHTKINIQNQFLKDLGII